MMDHWEGDSAIEFGLGIKIQIGPEIADSLILENKMTAHTHSAVFLCKLRWVSYRMFI